MASEGSDCVVNALDSCSDVTKERMSRSFMLMSSVYKQVCPQPDDGIIPAVPEMPDVKECSPGHAMSCLSYSGYILAMSNNRKTNLTCR